MALKIGFVREDRETGGASGCIGLRMGRRIEILADQALGGAGLLDLGDQAEAGTCGAVERLTEAARRRLFGGAGVKRGDRDGGLAPGHFLTFCVADFDQLVRHL